MTKLLSIIFFISIISWSCKKDHVKEVQEDAIGSFVDLFDSFWSKMNMRYVYWDIDSTNWKNCYNRYRSRFNALDIHSAVDQAVAVGYLKEMTSSLIDGHCQINCQFDLIQPSTINPSADKKRLQHDFHSPFVYAGVDSFFLDSGFIFGRYVTKSNEQVTALTGTIGKDIVYFSCSEFELREAFSAPGSNGVKAVFERYQHLLGSIAVQHNLRGLIIDVRNNPGGSLPDLSFFVGQLCSKDFVFGGMKYKLGPGPIDYTGWMDATIGSAGNLSVTNSKIVILVDQYTKSLAELVAIAIRTFPNSIIIGEQTWGATGTVSDGNLYNAGSFSVGRFLTVYTSASQFRTLGGQVIEGKGIVPDYSEKFDQQQLLLGKDNVLSSAITWLRQ